MTTQNDEKLNNVLAWQNVLPFLAFALVFSLSMLLKTVTFVCPTAFNKVKKTYAINPSWLAFTSKSARFYFNGLFDYW